MPASDALLLSLEPWAWPWTALALGLVVGSFANVCIYRLPLGRSLARPGSACPSCAASIRWFDNIPVLSWLLLGARCRRCGARISARYPLVELANGLLYFAVALRAPPGAAAALEMTFLTALLVLSLIDLDHQILPDVITLPGTALGLVGSLLPGPPSPLESALSAAGGYLGFAAVARAAEWYYGQEALGQGDWKMAALLGAFLGWRALLVTVFLACLVGAVVGLALIALRRGSRMTRIPLGTFLGLAGIAAVFAARPLLDWYGRLFRV
ncbi:MAG TPA: prepilin peptidase [Vicinamibacteria bacterium]|nr:prepilin peptidase [Vicinamibacteria bacterium]